MRIRFEQVENEKAVVVCVTLDEPCAQLALPLRWRADASLMHDECVAPGVLAHRLIRDDMNPLIAPGYHGAILVAMARPELMGGTPFPAGVEFEFWRLEFDELTTISTMPCVLGGTTLGSFPEGWHQARLMLK